MIISGNIKSVSGEPLMGANVIIIDESIGGIADIDGNFQIDIPDQYSSKTVRISYIGFAPQDFKAQELVDKKITLSEDNFMLNEVVLTADKIDYTKPISIAKKQRNYVLASAGLGISIISIAYILKNLK